MATPFDPDAIKDAVPNAKLEVVSMSANCTVPVGAVWPLTGETVAVNVVVPVLVIVAGFATRSDVVFPRGGTSSQ